MELCWKSQLFGVGLIGIPCKDKKPDNWVEEKRIVDEKAKKPDDWDDEEDGEWEAPMIDNPEYKGEWTVKRISNPAYKGGGCAKNQVLNNQRSWWIRNSDHFLFQKPAPDRIFFVISRLLECIFRHDCWYI